VLTSDELRAQYLATGSGEAPRDHERLDLIREVLAGEATWTEPPTHVVGGVLAAVVAGGQADTDRRSPDRPARWPIVAAAVGSAAALLALLVSTLGVLDNGRETLLAMTGTELQVGASGVAAVRPTGSGWWIRLELTGLAPAPEGSYYEGWVWSDDGEGVSIGTFHLRSGDDPVILWSGVDMEDYLHPTYLGRRTVAHNSSFGCPFSCSFCAVVAMTNRRWLAESPARMERVLGRLVRDYCVDAVQMHDMDFFINEARVAEFSGRITPLGVRWWGLGRIDTLMGYSNATWTAMVRSGLKMVFSGAESASDAVLATMNKGGKASARLALDLARRMKSFGVVPEYSFVLGSPPDPAGDMASTFEFIREIKRVNPATEIVLYTYTPVPMDGVLPTR